MTAKRGHSPDSRDLEDITAVDQCGSCGWSPAAVVLVETDDGHEWECYNCGVDPDYDGRLELDAGDDRDDQDDADDLDVPDEYDRDDVLDQADSVPTRATLTTKTIDGRSYYYYQWRDGEKVKSEYIGPVDPA